MKIIKNIILFSLIAVEALTLTSPSAFAICYSSKTNGEEIHQRSCADVFQSTGLISFYYTDGSMSFRGTATLIASDVLITAAHLLDPGKQVKTVCFQPQCQGQKSIVSNMCIQVKNVWIHPDYVDAAAIKNHDIAIIQLTQPLNHIRPAQLQKTLPDDFDSAPITVIGYGLSGNNNQGGVIDDGKRRSGDMKLVAEPFRKYLLSMTYTPNENGVGFIDSQEGSKYATIVQEGDSGGPAFIQINGEPFPRILGITNGVEKGINILEGGAPYVASIFMSVPYYYPWIESKLKLCNHPATVDSEESAILDYNKSVMGDDFQNLKNWFKPTYDAPGDAPRPFDNQERMPSNDMQDLNDAHNAYLNKLRELDEMARNLKAENAKKFTILDDDKGKMSDDLPSDLPSSSFYQVLNQENMAWNNIKDALSTASKRGSEVLQSLYDYASSSEYKQAFDDVLSTVSDEGLKLLYDYVEIHREMLFDE